MDHTQRGLGGRFLFGGSTAVGPPARCWLADFGAGLLIVYSHDGPFGIYGSRIFVPRPKESQEKRPKLVKQIDSPEQILLTCLLSAAGRWTDILPEVARQEQGNWWLLRMYGVDSLAYFGYDRKSYRGTETIRAVAAVSFAFRRVFGAIRCSGECKTIRTLGDFLATASCDEWDICYECIDPRAPFHPVIRPREDRTLALVGNIPYNVEFGKTEMQLPSTRCLSHPVCGRCRDAQQMEDLRYLDRHNYGPSSSNSS